MGTAQTIWIEVYKQMHGHKTKRADLADKEKKIYQTVVDCCSFSGYKRVWKKKTNIKTSSWVSLFFYNSGDC